MILSLLQVHWPSKGDLSHVKMSYNNQAKGRKFVNKLNQVKDPYSSIYHFLLFIIY